MLISAFPRRALLLVLVALPALLLLLAACGDDDDGGNNNTNTPAAGATTPAGGDTATPGSNGNGSDASDELKNLSADWAKNPATISYEFSSTYQGTTTTTVVTMYSRPPDSRIDFNSDAGKTIILNANGKGYTCYEASGNGQCIASDAGVSNPLPLFGDFASPDSINSAIGGLGDDLDTSDERIAGEDGKCFSANSSFTAGQGDAKWCFTDDGLLLLSSFGSADSSFTMKATEVKRGVSDSDFEPPYDIVTLPGQ